MPIFLSAEKFAVAGGAQKFFDIVFSGMDKKTAGFVMESLGESIYDDLSDIPFERLVLDPDERHSASLSRRSSVRDEIRRVCACSLLCGGIFWAKFLSVPPGENSSFACFSDIGGENKHVLGRIAFFITKTETPPSPADDEKEKESGTAYEKKTPSLPSSRESSEESAEEELDNDATEENIQVIEKYGEEALGLFSHVIKTHLDTFDEIGAPGVDGTLEDILERIGVSMLSMLCCASLDKESGEEVPPDVFLAWEFYDSEGALWEVCTGNEDMVAEYIENMGESDEEALDKTLPEEE